MESDLHVEVGITRVDIVAEWMISKSLATGHGDTIEDLLNEAEWQIVEREREACAKRLDDEAERHEQAMDGIADNTDHNEYTMHLCAATDFRSIAAAIRARSAPSPEPTSGVREER